jgi:hypothetical protein
MANPQWPASLQQYVNTDSFDYKFGNTILRSENDIGPAKVRARSTRGVDMITGAIDLSRTDYTTFEFFFKTTINGGARVFDFPHPITRVMTAVRMMPEPGIKAKGGTTFVVSFSLEVMP